MYCLTVQEIRSRKECYRVHTKVLVELCSFQRLLGRICFLPFSQLLETGCTPWPLAPSIKLAMAGCVFSQCISLKLTPLSPPSYLEDPGDYIGPI